MTKTISNHLAYGKAILERLQDVPVSTALAPYVAAFEAEFAAYKKACDKVDSTCAARDAALGGIAEVDLQMDTDVEDLATALVAAKLTPRANPFKGLSPHSPTVMKKLAYDKEKTAVRELVAEVLKKGPPAAVVEICSRMLSHANQVEAALVAVARPQAAYTTAIAARDELVWGLLRALSRLKAWAAPAWQDSPGTYGAVFAPPPRVMVPKKSRKPKKG